jgi:hypothetical protein
VILKFADLGVLEQDRLEPVVRLFFTGLLAVIIGLLFYLKIIEVKLGSVSSADFFNRSDLALLIGAFCGLSEQVLPSRVSQQAEALLKSGK